MHCTNEKHHHGNGEECFINDNSCDNRGKENFNTGTPHSMHWHINKTSFKGWALNFLYLSLHAVEIYLIVTKL
jgi:hypothetical protein